jgi:hypothetical protein
MKKFLTPSILTVLALWIGYGLGYHQGSQGEPRAWEARSAISQNPAALLYVEELERIPVIHGPEHIPAVRSSRIINVTSSGSASVNVPDPRNFQPRELFTP